MNSKLSKLNLVDPSFMPDDKPEDKKKSPVAKPKPASPKVSGVEQKPAEPEGKITIGWDNAKKESPKSGVGFDFPEPEEAPGVPKETFYQPITKEKKGSQSKSILFFIFDVVLNAAIIIGLVILIRSNLISPFQVYGPSMCDTLNKIDGECVKAYGEYIIVNKFIYRNFWGYQFGDPERGDIVVFHPPHKEDDFYIKRIVGLPGDKVKLKHGYVEIYNDENPDGFRLAESYLSQKNSGKTLADPRGYSEFTVPEGEYFLMGDNRGASNDSRQCFRESGCSDAEATPYLKRANIEGKAWFVLLPLQNIRVLSDNGVYSEEEK